MIRSALDLAATLGPEIERHHESSLAEVFEYAGMLAAAASDCSKSLAVRSERAHHLLRQLAASALSVAFRGDERADLAAADYRWMSCSHEEAVKHALGGTNVRSHGWKSGLSVRFLNGHIVINGCDQALELREAEASTQLLTGKAYGIQIQWSYDTDEEIPF